MSNDYSREVLRRVVAQVCQIIGWQGINSTPMDILVHILEKYILTLCTQTHRYAEQFNRTEPNLHDLGLVFRDVHIPLQELKEYIRCVPPVPCQLNVPNFPLPKETHLNFLKPGSQEVVTRPVYVHEYLPAMHPDKETPPIADTVEITHNGIEEHIIMQEGGHSPEISVTDELDKSKDVFKRPTDPVSFTPPSMKRSRHNLEEEDSRTREISSVMMTMSGFLSPAREGKLPEARTPVTMHHHPEKPKLPSNTNTTTPHNPPVLHKNDHVEKKTKKNKSLNGKVEKTKKKDRSHKHNLTAKQNNAENKINKLAMHLARGKVRPSSSVKHHANEMPPLKQLPPTLENNTRPIIKQEVMDHDRNTPSSGHNEHMMPPPPQAQLLRNPLAMAEHSHHKNSHSHNIPPPMAPIGIKEEIMDDEKLTSQPDRSKLNIFKKISSKIKDEKPSLPNQDSHAPNDYGAFMDKINHSAPTSSGIPQDKEVHKRKMHHVKEIIDSVVSNSAVDLSSRKLHPSNDLFNDTLGIIRNPIKQEAMNEIPRDFSKSKLPPSPHLTKSGHMKEKKERKHKERKPKQDKALKEFTKMMKKSQMAHEQLKQLENQEIMGMRMPPSFLLPNLLANQGLLPGGGLLPPGPGLIPGIFPGIGNPVLRGMLPTESTKLANPFATTPSVPGSFPPADIFPRPGLIPPNFINNPLFSQFPHTFGKPPPMAQHPNVPSYLRRPSLEVIPIEDNNQSSSKQYISPPLVIKEKEKEKSEKIKLSHNNFNLNSTTKVVEFNSSIHSRISPPKVNSSLSIQPVRPDVTIKMNVTERHKPLDTPKPEPILPPSLPTQSEPPPTPVKEKEKDKSEKKKDKLHKKEKKDKELKMKKKKEKKEKLKIKIEKKKDKEERQELKERLKKEKREKRKEKEERKEKEKLSALPEGLVPKLTLKLGSSSPMPPSSPETTRKLNIKPIIKKDEPPPPVEPPSLVCEERIPVERAHSPELARISALVTRPPKMKSSSKHNNLPKSDTSSDLNSSLSPPPQQSSTSPHRKNKSSSSFSRYKRIFFKPIPKKGSLDEPGMDLDDLQPSPSVSIPEKPPNVPLGKPFYMDSQGNKVWICPACGQQDNGSPMIGCDGGCDGWYHWECVGIRIAPDDNEDWYCVACKAKRTAMASALAAGQIRKKRGRKPKAEKLKEIH